LFGHGEIRRIEACVFVSYGSDGRAQRVVGVDIDVTTRKHGDEQQRALNAELDHRVKNMLATVSRYHQSNPKSRRLIVGLRGRVR
jgi:hypothetical protein